jgi:hypothetical protein
MPEKPKCDSCGTELTFQNTAPVYLQGKGRSFWKDNLLCVDCVNKVLEERKNKYKGFIK